MTASDPEPATTPTQLDVLEHALGLNRVTAGQRRRFRKLANCFRNHFVADPEHADWPDLLVLEQRECMTRRTVPVPIGPATEMFFVTALGFETLRMHGRVPAMQRQFNFEGRS